MKTIIIILFGCLLKYTLERTFDSMYLLKFV